MGLEWFKYYDSRMAEAVTANGQVMLKYGASHVNDIMNRVGKDEAADHILYMDTDSIFIKFEPFVKKFCSNMNRQETVDYLEKFVIKVIQPELDKRFKVLLDKMGSINQQIFFKIEKIGNILITSKKKYIFDMYYDEGVRYAEPKMKVMGIEVVRSSTPNTVKDYLKKSLLVCLRGTESELQKNVLEIKKEFMTQDYSNIAFPRGVNGLTTYSDSANIYKQGCPMHVRASLLYNHTLKRLNLESKYPKINDGDKIKYVALKMPNYIHENVIGFPEKLPAEFNLNKFIDYETQFQKSFLKPLEGILEAVGWTATEKITLDFD